MTLRSELRGTQSVDTHTQSSPSPYRGPLLSWLWLTGQRRLTDDPIWGAEPCTDHWARYGWLYAQGGQCDLAQLGTWL